MYVSSRSLKTGLILASIIRLTIELSVTVENDNRCLLPELVFRVVISGNFGNLF